MGVLDSSGSISLLVQNIIFQHDCLINEESIELCSAVSGCLDRRLSISVSSMFLGVAGAPRGFLHLGKFILRQPLSQDAGGD